MLSVNWLPYQGAHQGSPYTNRFLFMPHRHRCSGTGRNPLRWGRGDSRIAPTVADFHPPFKRPHEDGRDLFGGSEGGIAQVERQKCSLGGFETRPYQL